MAFGVDDAVIAAGIKKGATQIVKIAGPFALKQIKEYLSGNHGSKVKEFAYAECKIARFDHVPCIVVDEGSGKIIPLSSDTIEKYTFIKEKKRMVGVKLKTYFYYDITFKNGERSRIRISRKNCDAMLRNLKSAGADNDFVDAQSDDNAKKSSIAEEAAANLIQKFAEAKENIAFNLDDILRENYKQNERDGIETLHRHLGEDILITGLWKKADEETEVEEEGLLEGELSAFTFKIGNYLIRSSMRLYQDTDENTYYQRIPATQDRLAVYAASGNMGGYIMLSEREGVREVHEISAKYQGTGDEDVTEDWNFVCLATEEPMGKWRESIDFIGTVKKNSSVLEKQEALFVQKNYFGDAHCSKDWYKMTSDGKVTEYQECREYISYEEYVDGPWEL